MSSFSVVWALCLSKVWRLMGILVAVGAMAVFAIRPAFAEGSVDLYPDPPVAGARRANLEWRNSNYGPVTDPIRRRTLIQVFANAGEFILVGSSAAGIANAAATQTGNALIYDPGQVTGSVGQRVVPDPSLAAFDCNVQRVTFGGTLGQIQNPNGRLKELAGPDTIDPLTGIPLGGVTNGYAPCFYAAPLTGIYSVVFTGPEGFDSNLEINPTGDIALVSANNFNDQQSTSVSAWDITVRADPMVATNLPGRAFSDYLTLFSGGNGRQIFSTIFIITTDGYRYRTEIRGSDPNGYVVYGNRVGFFDSDGATPLYRNIMADPTLTTTGQNQLQALQGSTRLALPEFPIFFNLPDPAALTALGIPLAPTAPTISNFEFEGSLGGNTSLLGAGGTFTFTSNIAGTYELVISRDAVDFDPTNLLNRALRSTMAAGTTTIVWDGNDNNGDPFPVGSGYLVQATVRGGEYHFPLLDGENNTLGGPTYELINPPGGVCPPLAAGCFTTFYDDRGYETLGGVLVGVAVNGALCPGVPEPGSPPVIRSAYPNGFDSSTSQRAFGFATGGNPAALCQGPPTEGGFGDKKGLDLWTFYPSAAALQPVVIVATAPSATPTPTSTSTPTNTPTLTNTPPPGASSTPTLTNTPPPGASSTPTGTPTLTNTPPPGASLTPTGTPPPGASLTPTSAPPPGGSATSLPPAATRAATPTVDPGPGATEIPETGSGPGPGQLPFTIVLWLLAALSPLAGWQVWRVVKARRQPRP